MHEGKHMPDLLVPDLDPATYERLRQAAADQGKSLAQMARDLLAEKLQPSSQLPNCIGALNYRL
jgi:plasmid stability protein